MATRNKTFTFRCNFSGIRLSPDITSRFRGNVDRDLRYDKKVYIYYWHNAIKEVEVGVLALKRRQVFSDESKVCGYILKLDMNYTSAEVTMYANGMLGSLVDDETVSNLVLVPVVDSGMMMGFVLTHK